MRIFLTYIVFTLAVIFVVGGGIAHATYVCVMNVTCGKLSALASFNAATIRDVSFVSSNEVWVASDNGKVAKFNGSAWTDYSGGTLLGGDWGTAHIHSISASSSTNVWLVGVGGQTHKYNGSTWTQHLSGGPGVRWETDELNSISALTESGVGKAFMVGVQGNAWMYNGTTWCDRNFVSGSCPGSGSAWASGAWGTSVTLNSVSFLSSTSAWIVGNSGNVWEYNGTTWTQHSGTGRWGNVSVLDVVAYTPTSAFITTLDGQVWEYDGIDWTQHLNGQFGGSAVNDASDKYSTEVWTVGSSGQVFQLNPPKWSLAAVGAVPANDDVVVNGITYSRNLYIQNICRNTTTGDITVITDTNGTATTCTGSPSGDAWDRSTVKITTTVSWPGGDPVVRSEYVTRWINAVCTQTAWSVADSTLETRECPTTAYSSDINYTFFMNTGDALTETLPVSTQHGVLASSAFETIGIGGLQAPGPLYNSMEWRGDEKTGSVRFRFAAFDCPGGQNNPPTCDGAFVGFLNPSTCSTSFFDPGGPNIPFDMNCSSFVNKRFFAYQVQICNTSNCAVNTGSTVASPVVEDVIINWSP